MLLSVDNVMKAFGHNGNHPMDSATNAANSEQDTDSIAALKFTERIEREVLIVAGISDCGNYTVN